MTLKHTPAPWVYDQKRTNVLAEGRELLVANIRGWGNLQKRSDGAEIMDANGRLIAAAPELFAELVEARIYINLNCGLNASAILSRIDNVIAKAVLPEHTPNLLSNPSSICEEILPE